MSAVRHAFPAAWPAFAAACVMLLCALGPAPLAAKQVDEVPVVTITGDDGDNADDTPAAPDPIAMAVTEVLRGRKSMLKVLPKLDPAIVPALEQAYLASLSVDEDSALLLVARLGDDRYEVRELASRALVDVKAEIDPALKKLRETVTDPEILWRLDDVLLERPRRPLRDDSVLNQALQLVYETWFNDLVKERAERLLNDPQDDPAALFFAQAPGEKIAAAIAARPPLEQAKLWLSTVRMLGSDARSIRALGQLKPEILVQAARETGWPAELPQPDTAQETILYEAIEGNSLLNVLFIPHKDKRLYVVKQAFCIFQLPFGPGNPRPQTGAILRGRTEFRLDTGATQPFTSRRLFFGVPPGMLLPKFRFVEGLDEDWNATLVRMPLWSKPFVPPAALKDTMKFVLNGAHELPQPAAEDQNLTPGVTAARLRKRPGDFLAAPAPAPAADPATPPPAEEWETFHNADAEQLPAVLRRLGATGRTAWISVCAQVAQSNRARAGRAALDALFALDPGRAGAVALRLTRVQWRTDRARYAVEFLKDRFAQTALERAWDVEHRLEPPADLVKRIPAPRF